MIYLLCKRKIEYASTKRRIASSLIVVIKCTTNFGQLNNLPGYIGDILALTSLFYRT